MAPDRRESSVDLMRMSFLSRFITALSLLLTLCRLAQADELPIDLRWIAPEDCGTARSVLADVKLMLERTSWTGPSEVIQAEATLRKTSQGKWEVLLRTTLGNSRGERSIVVADCAEATHATALLLAFMLNPNQALPEQAEESRPSVDKPTAPQPPTPPVGAPQHPVAAMPGTVGPSKPKSLRAPVRVQVGLSGMVDSGNLPHETLGGALHLGLQTEQWSIELRPAAWLPSQVASPQLSSAGGQFRLYDVALVSCYRAFRRGSLSAQTCAGADLLHLRGTGFGITKPSGRSALYPSAMGELALLFDLTQDWTVRAAGEVLLALARPEYAIFNLGMVHRPARWTGRLGLGFEWRF